MSAPQTARERADDFIRWWVANNNSSLDQISNELTERIQAAERSAIERAAKVVETDPAGSYIYRDTKSRIAQAIRSLIT